MCHDIRKCSQEPKRDEMLAKINTKRSTEMKQDQEDAIRFSSIAEISSPAEERLDTDKAIELACSLISMAN